MTEREQIDEILERIQRNMIGYIDWISPVGRGLLAAPLEAANARIKALEHALRLLEQSASAISNRDGQSKAHRTAADWSRLNSHIDIARAAIAKAGGVK